MLELSVHAAPDIVESKKPSDFHVKKEDILWSVKKYRDYGA
jgi:hypothetical protein